MKKTLAIIIAALGCATANAQEINAVVTRQGTTNKNCYQLSSQPNVIFGEGNTITVKEGETAKEQYTLSGSNTLTVLFGSAISSEVNAQNLEVTNPIYILDNGKLTVSETMNNANANNLVIEDGGQLRFESGTVNAQAKKEITGYSEGDGNWYLVASPVTEATPTAVGMIDQTTPENYDLYIFDQTKLHEEWRNNKVSGQEIQTMENQNGYLYAHKNGTTLVFDGELAATATAKNLEFDNDAEFKGFNLIGNPYTCDAYIDRNFYRMNTNGTELIPASGAIHALEGVFVQATATGESVTFSKDAPATQNGMCAMTLSQGTATIDRAIVNFGKGEGLDKFMLNESNTKLFIPQNSKDFAAVATEATAGEMPVSFKAAKDGNYTITVNTDNVQAEYMHLIDNMTGMDIDLLATPSYSFEAKTSDYASRFKLVFGVKDETSEASENFAYISNGEIIISNEGRATLQVIDVLGRIISSEEINGECRISTNGMTAGLYILSLNGKTQKIVVR